MLWAYEAADATVTALRFNGDVNHPATRPEPPGRARRLTLLGVADGDRGSGQGHPTMLRVAFERTEERRVVAVQGPQQVREGSASVRGDSRWG